MRRLLVLVILLGLMGALPYLQVEVDSGINSKSLGTLGFILLAAFTFGELTNLVGFPRITGYILTGVAFGPHAIDLFSLGVVQDLTLINALAIGLIALTAGGEMKIEGLLRVARSLSLLLLLKCLTILLATIACVWLLQPWLPFLSGATMPLVLSVGLIFGVLALGTSPAVTIAVINETGSRGRLSDLFLGVAVAKDVLMVALLALGVSLVNLFSTAGAVFDLSVIAHVGEELLFSVLAGGVVGLLTIAYIRLVHSEMWLFVIGLVFLGTTVAELLHLEALLMFITAGFIVQNLSPYGEKFIHPIEEVALPVYVVFFSIAGAGLDLSAVAQVGLVALALVLVRLVAIFVGSRLATVLAGETYEVRQNAWLGFIPQAGVVLGLSILIAEYLEIGPQIQLIVLATLAFNLVVGPVTLKLALSRAGETAQKRSREVIPEESAGVQAVVSSVETGNLGKRIGPPSFSSKSLNDVSNLVRERLIELEGNFFESVVQPGIQPLREFAQDVSAAVSRELLQLREDLDRLPSASGFDCTETVRRSRERLSDLLSGKMITLAATDRSSQQGKKAFARLQELLAELGRSLPARLEVALEPSHLLEQPGDGLTVRSIKSSKRQLNKVRLLVTGKPIQRVVPVRQLARYQFEGRFPVLATGTAYLFGGLEIRVLRRIHQVYEDLDAGYDRLIETTSSGAGEDPGPRVEALDKTITDDLAQLVEDLQGQAEDVRRGLTECLVQTYRDLTRQMELAGTFQLSARSYRLSRLFKASQDARRDVQASFDRWHTWAVGLAGHTSKHAEIVSFTDRVHREIGETLLKPMETWEPQWQAAIQGSAQLCRQIPGILSEKWPTEPGKKVEEVLEIARQQEAELTGALKKCNRLLDESRADLAGGSVLESLLPRLGALTDPLPEYYQVIDPRDQRRLALNGSMPPDVPLHHAPVRDVAKGHLETHIARRISEVSLLGLRAVDSAIDSVTRVSLSIGFNWKTACDELREAEGAQKLSVALETLESALRRAAGQLERTLQSLQDLPEQVRGKVGVEVRKDLQELEKLIQQASTLDLRLQQVQKHAAGRWEEALASLSRGIRARARLLLRRFQPLGKEVVQDLKDSLGLARYSSAQVVAFYDQAEPNRLSKVELPFVYHRLFDIAPLESGEFLVARDDEKQLMLSAMERWRRGMKCSVAVIGELGSGKTSFLNSFTESTGGDLTCLRANLEETCYREKELARFLAGLLRFPRIRTFEGLAERIESLPDRRLVILEDTHRLFLRVTGGFEGLKKLLLLIGRSSDKIFWVVSMREFSWRYLDKALGVGDYFTYVINMENLSAAEIEEVIATRHRVSGFDLEFLPDAYIRERRKFRLSSPEERQRLIRREFFSQLSRASEGNILAAIFYWLRSITEVRENSLLIGPFRRMNFDFLREMSVEKLLTLGLTIQHGSLSASQHARIFGSNEREGLSILTHLRNINLMTEQSTDQAESGFSINKIVYKALSRELRERNILH